MASSEVSVNFKPHDENAHQIQDGINEISVPGASTKSNLDDLLNKNLLQDPEETQQSFTYIIGNQLFNSETLSQHILSHNLNTEKAIEIIFFLKVDQPKPRLAYPHDDWVSSIDINSDFIVSSTFEGTVHLWSLEDEESHKANQDSEKLLRAKKVSVSKDLNFKAHSQSVKCVKFLNHSANTNAFITTSSDQTSIIWDVSEKQIKEKSKNLYKVSPLFKLKGHTEQVEAATSSRSHIVTTSADRMIKLWEASLTDDEDTGNESGEPNPKTSKVGETAEKAAAASQKGRPRNPLMTISGHSAIITDVMFDNHARNSKINDTVLTASLDHSLRVWDIEIAKQKDRLQTAKAILSLDCNDDNSAVATGSSDRHVRIYDRKDFSRSVVNNLSYHQGWVSSVKFNPNNRYQLLSTSYDKEAVLWDIRSSKEPLYCLEAHKDRVYCSAWGANGILATGGADNNMATWKI